jgi:hypothetical protein
MSKADDLAEIYGPLLQMDGFDDAILGVATRCGCEPVLVYSREKIIDSLVKDSEMDEFEANEYYEFNIAGAWMGDNTPYVLEDEDASYD